MYYLRRPNDCTSLPFLNESIAPAKKRCWRNRRRRAGVNPPSKKKSVYLGTQQCNCSICKDCSRPAEMSPPAQKGFSHPACELPNCYPSLPAARVCLLPFPTCTKNEESMANNQKPQEPTDCETDTCPVDWDLQEIPTDLMIQQLATPKYREVTADLQVKVKGHVFKCHRFLLAHYSRYFYNLLKQRQGKMFVEVIINEINPEAFNVVYDWMYSCHLHLCPENLVDVLHTSQCLEIPEVIVLCMEYLNKMVESPELLLGLYNLAMAGGKRCLGEHILRLMAVVFRFVIRHPLFLCLDSEALCFLLSCDNLNVSCEKEAFDAAFMWVCEDMERRRCHAVEVLSAIRFGHMSDEDLFDCLYCEATQQIMSIPECRLFVLQGYLYHTAKALGTLDQFPQLNVPVRRPLSQQLHSQEDGEVSSYGNLGEDANGSGLKGLNNSFHPASKSAPSALFPEANGYKTTVEETWPNSPSSGNNSSCFKAPHPLPVCEVCKSSDPITIKQDSSEGIEPSFQNSPSVPRTTPGQLNLAPLPNKNGAQPCPCPKLCTCFQSCPCRKFCSCSQPCSCPRLCLCQRSCSCPKLCSCKKQCPCPKTCTCAKTCPCSGPCSCPKSCACPKICKCSGKSPARKSSLKTDKSCISKTFEPCCPAGTPQRSNFLKKHLDSRHSASQYRTVDCPCTACRMAQHIDHQPTKSSLNKKESERHAGCGVETTRSCGPDNLYERCLCEDVSSATGKKATRNPSKNRWWGWRKTACDSSRPLPIGIDFEMQCRAILQAECIAKKLDEQKDGTSHSRAGGNFDAQWRAQLLQCQQSSEDEHFKTLYVPRRRYY